MEPLVLSDAEVAGGRACDLQELSSTKWHHQPDISRKVESESHSVTLDGLEFAM